MKEVRYERRALDELVAADYNPRTISGPALNGLKRSLDRFGLVQPIVVNARTSTIVGGHQRVRALLEQGETEVQVALVELSPAEERALNVALNSPHIAGEFTDDLQSLLEQIRAESPQLMDDLRLDALLENDLDGKDLTDLGEPEFGLKVVIECEDEEQQSALLAEFQERGLNCAALML